MKIAIMQPYLFPYIGYFQMINAVDTFVFYDDVNFIKRGWVNRNKILVNGNEKLFTIPLIDASQNKLINEIEINSNNKELNKLLNTISQNYKKAPHFEQVFPLIKGFLNLKQRFISEMAVDSIKEISKYLKIDTEFILSSEKFSETRGDEKEERLVSICQSLNASEYINAIGGAELYSKNTFFDNGIKLNFIQSNKITYNQYRNDFVPWLSIIDVLMFNSKIEINSMLNDYKLL